MEANKNIQFNFREGDVLTTVHAKNRPNRRQGKEYEFIVIDELFAVWRLRKVAEGK